MTFGNSHRHDEECYLRVIRNLDALLKEQTAIMFLTLKRAPTPQEFRENAEWLAAVIEIGNAQCQLAKLN